MRNSLILIAMFMLLAGCNRAEQPYHPEHEKTRTDVSRDNDQASDDSVVASSSADYEDGDLEPENTDDMGEEKAVFGKDGVNNDISTSTTVWRNHLYSTHDKYHKVTCWFMDSKIGGWALSCLPDSQVAHPEK